MAGLSYKTLRDSAFSVTNGQVTRARRKTKGSSQSWTITVKPDSSAAVTIRMAHLEGLLEGLREAITVRASAS